MNGEVKGMKERLTERLTEKRIVEITNAAIDAPSNLFKIKGREWCIDLLGEVELLNQQLTEKDATIGKLHERVSHYTAVRDNAVNHGYEQAMEIKRLRKALGEAKSTFGIIATHSTDEKAVKVATDGFNLMESALGEGDKEKVNFTLHNSGYVKHKLSFDNEG